MVTTEDKQKKQIEDMHRISVLSDAFHKVDEFKLYEITAIQIDGKW